MVLMGINSAHQDGHAIAEKNRIGGVFRAYHLRIAQVIVLFVGSADNPRYAARRRRGK